MSCTLMHSTRTHEDLQERSYNQDCQIQDLLLQFDKLKSEARIRQWIARSDTVQQGKILRPL